jgi:hypothetical protein
MARSKPIKTTADALAWISDQVSAGRLKQPKVIERAGGETVVVYEHACTRCGGSGLYVALSGGGGPCFACSNGTIYKRLAPLEFVKRLRVNLRAQERRAEAKQARLEASKARNLARGYGEVTGMELHRAIDRAAVAFRKSKAQLRQHVGAEGERLAISVAVTRANEVNTRFGTKTVTDLVTDDGHVLTVWGKAAVAEGDRPRVRIEATVKRHTFWQGEARTELADVTVTSVDGQDPAATAEELLVVADLLEARGSRPFADVDLQQLAKDSMPEWRRAEWTDHPATRAAILALRCEAGRRCA